MHSIDFAGNLPAKKTLASLFESGRFPHAVILEGPAGCGKKTFARIMAKTLVCQSAERPCGTCAACRKTEEGTHPDVTVLGGSGGSRSFHIQAIREMKQDVFIRPNDGDYKIFILQDAGDMTEQAQNALLKILEEPPAYAVFILTVQNKAALLDTVLSRSAVIPLRPVELPELTEYLQKKHPELPKERIGLAAARSEGLVGRAESFLAEQSGKDGGGDRAAALCRAAVEPREFALLSLLGGFEKDKQGFSDCLSRCVLILRDAAVCKAGAFRLAGTDGETAAFLAERLPAGKILNGIAAAQVALLMLEQNVNYGLLLCDFCKNFHDALSS